MTRISNVILSGTVILFIVSAGSKLNLAFAQKPSVKRIDVFVSKSQRAQFKDLTQSLQMVSLTPIIDRNDEVICLEVSEIKNPVISKELKVKKGDCFSHVVIFKKNDDGSQSSERHSVLSPAASFVLYPELVEAERIDVDLKRGKSTVPLSYRLN